MTHHAYFLLSLLLSITSYYTYGNEPRSANQPKSYTLQEFLNAPDTELRAHKKS